MALNAARQLLFIAIIMALTIILTILATLHSQVKLTMVVQPDMLGEEISNPKEYNTGGFKRIEGSLTSGTETVLLKTVRPQVASGFPSYSADFRVYSYQNRCGAIAAVVRKHQSFIE